MSFATRFPTSFSGPTLSFVFLVDQLWPVVQEKAIEGTEDCVTALTKAIGTSTAAPYR